MLPRESSCGPRAGGENPRENSSPGRGEVKGNEEGGTSGPQMPGSKRIKKPRAKAKSKVAKAWKKERA